MESPDPFHIFDAWSGFKTAVEIDTSQTRVLESADGWGTVKIESAT